MLLITIAIVTLLYIFRKKLIRFVRDITHRVSIKNYYRVIACSQPTRDKRYFVRTVKTQKDLQKFTDYINSTDYFSFPPATNSSDVIGKMELSSSALGDFGSERYILVTRDTDEVVATCAKHEFLIRVKKSLQMNTWNPLCDQLDNEFILGHHGDDLIMGAMMPSLLSVRKDLRGNNIHFPFIPRMISESSDAGYGIGFAYTLNPSENTRCVTGPWYVVMKGLLSDIFGEVWKDEKSDTSTIRPATMSDTQFIKEMSDLTGDRLLISEYFTVDRIKDYLLSRESIKTIVHGSGVLTYDVVPVILRNGDKILVARVMYLFSETHHQVEILRSAYRYIKLFEHCDLIIVTPAGISKKNLQSSGANESKYSVTIGCSLGFKNLDVQDINVIDVL